MSWLPIAVPFLVGLILLFVPGLMVAIAMRVRGFDAFGIAPALSVAMIAISAMVAPMVGVNWAIWVPFVFALLIALLAFIVQQISVRGSKVVARKKVRTSAISSVAIDDEISKTGVALQSSKWFSKDQALYWGSFALGAILLLRNVKNSIGQPDWISQSFDNNFHLNAIRFIEETGNASSMHIAAMTSNGEAFFYPAAWHDVVSLIFMSTGTTIPLATSTMALLVSAVVWPLSVVFMVRNIFRVNAPAVLVAGILAASFTAFPILLLGFGVLYPNLLGVALIPAGIAVIVQMFRLAPTRLFSTTQTVFMGLFVALGIALAHPNAIMSLLVIIIPIFVTRGVLQVIAAFRRETVWWVVLLQVAGIAAILWFVNYLWGVVRPEKEAGIIWGPVSTQAQAFGEAAVNATLGDIPQWFVTILFLAGVYALFRVHNRHIWLIASWCVIVFFYAAARYLPWEEDRYWVVGVWYHDAYRLAALLPIITIPITVWAVHWLAEISLASRVWEKLPIKRETIRGGKNEAVLSAPTTHQTGLIVLSVFAILLTGWLGQTSKALTKQVENTFWAYAPSGESRLLTINEMKLLKELDEYVPTDDEIIVQPFTGSSLAYAIADRKVTAYHTIYESDPDVKYIEDHFDDALTDPKVCSIIEADKMDYYLDFGRQEVNYDDHTHRYQGFVDIKKLEDAGFLSEVHREGDVVLYEVSGCQ